jgi:diadenosine tetraphosphate (Ap4A) HIT family hydrolase
MATGCVFCDEEGGQLLWRDARCRVVLTDEPFPGFCRVIWNAHVREMTDLAAPNRAHLMHVVYAVESALRARLTPTKMNLASLGNQTPHLHWHLIPRFADIRISQPVWGRASAMRRRLHARRLRRVACGDLAAMLGAAALRDRCRVEMSEPNIPDVASAGAAGAGRCARRFRRCRKRQEMGESLPSPASRWCAKPFKVS